MAESGELAVDAAIVPGGILGSQAHNQGARLRGSRVARVGSVGRSSGGDELTVPPMGTVRVVRSVRGAVPTPPGGWSGA